MIGMNKYLSAYVDRRMKYIVDEWELATKTDVSDFTGRLEVLEHTIPGLKEFERLASDKLTELETRASKLKGRV